MNKIKLKNVDYILENIYELIDNNIFSKDLSYNLLLVLKEIDNNQIELNIEIYEKLINELYDICEATPKYLNTLSYLINRNTNK